MRKTVGLTALAIALFAAFHSALAARSVKRRIETIVGGRATNGLYRFGFNAIAVVSFGATLVGLWRLPDRPLYRLHGLPALVMRVGQVLCAGALLETNRQNGFGRVSGLRHAVEYITGHPISDPPVAQHPPPEGPCLAGWTGPFRVSSHPNNYIALILYWLSPAMTVKWATVGLITAIYMVLGSLHEDRRLIHAYGERYACYRAHVPHLRLVSPTWMHRSDR